MGAGFLLASIWFGQQAAVADLQKGQLATVRAQEEMTGEIKALRLEMKEGLATRSELNEVKSALAAQAVKLEAMDNSLWALKIQRAGAR